MKKLNNYEKLCFFRNRKRIGDIQYLSEITGYSKSHIYNMLNYNRSMSNTFANNLYLLTFRRKRNEDLIKNLINI